MKLWAMPGLSACESPLHAYERAPGRACWTSSCIARATVAVWIADRTVGDTFQRRHWGHAFISAPEAGYRAGARGRDHRVAEPASDHLFSMEPRHRLLDASSH